VLGMASDAGPTEGATDPLAPARTVRRALADAGRKAVEVSHLVAADSRAAGDVAAFSRTALGQHGLAVEAITVADAVVLDAAAEVTPGADLIIAVLAARNGTLALCLEQSARPRGDGETDSDRASQSIVK
jgi:hypothetical protein